MTEHRGSPTFEQMIGMLERVDLANLEDGNILETARMQKNVEILISYQVGVVAEDGPDYEESTHALELSRKMLLAAQATLSDAKITNLFTAVSNGEALSVAYSDALNALAYALSFFDAGQSEKLQLAAATG